MCCLPVFACVSGHGHIHSVKLTVQIRAQSSRPGNFSQHSLVQPCQPWARLASWLGKMVKAMLWWMARTMRARCHRTGLTFRHIGIGPGLAIGIARSTTCLVGLVATTGWMGSLANGAGVAWPVWSCTGPACELQSWSGQGHVCHMVRAAHPCHSELSHGQGHGLSCSPEFSFT